MLLQRLQQDPAKAQGRTCLRTSRQFRIALLRHETDSTKRAAPQTERYGAQKTCALEAGASETLRVTPVPKRLRTVAPGKGTWTERWGTALNLHFEGNWMPLLVGDWLRRQPQLHLSKGGR